MSNPYAPYPVPFKAVAIADFQVAPIRTDKIYRVSDVRYQFNFVR